MITIVAGVLRRPDGAILLVRKKGTVWFMLPGGKREATEHDLETLRRELAEELGFRNVSINGLLGRFDAPAANEPGCCVAACVYSVAVTDEPTPLAEIAELVWVHPARPEWASLAIAPLVAGPLHAVMSGAQFG
ncbi:NUDIX domain-containing protein [Ameyamaea chiangmaiensis]|uniref:NUDIX hydrolase n=1 Tax=Ameyamaea chiangmaiensis TaxID=442969 RepID=UPI001BAF6C56|nr:NUDIX domain-containing protein [Ameyamaea chiangmaiensis]MBS4075402.1 NUDIX domain-containing protein [Ameyamaea chiangmaiensis]